MAVGDASDLHKQKRARSQLSCMPCRAGKLKCNRLRDPACDQCIKRNRESACQYIPPPAKAKPVTNVKGRIRQLENLVKELMVQQDHTPTTSSSESASQHTPPSDNDGVSSGTRPTWSKRLDANVEGSVGELNIDGSRVAYTGQNHWQTILTSLSDIQNDLGEDGAGVQESAEDESQANTSAPQNKDVQPSGQHQGFLLGNTEVMTREELIAMVPDKRTCDRLLSLWFNSPDPFKIIIHAPTFQDEYKRFQKDQSVSTMWIGLLFAILCLAESFGLRNQQPGAADNTACVERVELYQSLTASAAVLAGYTKPKEYTIECLMLHMVGLRGDNAAMNAWVVMGIVVRLALRLGYHRDPSHYDKITAFDAEMRRRIWTMANMIDVLMSFQLGLPSMMRTLASDTQPPTNLLDRDFAKHMLFLPVARGEHELTQSLYVRSKLRIIHVFAEAAELSHATIPPSFETIQNLDTELERAKQALPAALQMPEISEMVTDPAEQLMCRFNLDLLYLKCKIVLFRRYMLVPIGELGPEDQLRGIGSSRKACIYSARRVLDHHHTIYQAVQPGGQLEQMKWYMGSIAVHDFLLAAMVICLELSQQLHRDKMLRISGGMNCPTRQAMLKSLEQSHAIWQQSANRVASTIHDPETHDRDTEEDTAKACRAMAAMLARIRAQRTRGSAQAGGQEDRQEVPEPRQNLFEAESGTYFHQIGLTKAGVRAMDERQEPYRGVLVRHNWDGVPDDIDLTIAATDPATYTGVPPDETHQGFSLTTHADGTTEDSDAMNLDWQAWDNEIFNANRNLTDWSQQDYSLFQGSDEQLKAFQHPTYPTTATHGLSEGHNVAEMPIDLSGLDLTMEDMESFDFGVGSVYTPFIENEKTAAWVRSPRT